MIRRPPRSTPFPYTTLSRSSVLYESEQALIDALPELARRYEAAGVHAWTVWVPEHHTEATAALAEAGHALDADPRSEEHTSELQSRQYLVCRLLLEKKKQ